MVNGYKGYHYSIYGMDAVEIDKHHATPEEIANEMIKQGYPEQDYNRIISDINEYANDVNSLEIMFPNKYACCWIKADIV